MRKFHCVTTACRTNKNCNFQLNILVKRGAISKYAIGGDDTKASVAAS